MVKHSTKQLFFLLLLTLSHFVSCQDFGDEWINRSQPYFKIKVAEEGLYKLSYELLKQQAPSSFLQSNKLQVWHRGVQQAIAVHAHGDLLQADDYVAFYGIKNNGEQDSLLYRPATNLYNPHSNLFSDTTAYFLTLSEAGPWKRMDTLATNSKQQTAVYIRKEFLRSYSGEYWQTGNEGQDPLQTHFEPGEGWYNLDYPEETVQLIDATDYLPHLDSAIIEAYVACIARTIFTPRFYLLSNSGTDSLFLGQVADSINKPFGAVKARFSLSTDLSNYISNGQLKLLISHVGKGQLTVSYVYARYPSLPALSPAGKGSFWTGPAPSSRLSLKNETAHRFFALVTQRNKATWIEDSTANGQTHLPTLPPNSKVFHTVRLDSVHTLWPVTFREYSATDSLYVVLTNDSLHTSAIAYAGYRKSSAGGGFDTVVANIKNIIDQYSYGEVTPLAIRRFLNRLKSQNTKSPDYLFIIGSGISLDQRFSPYGQVIRDSYSHYNYVLPAGVPGGDFTFSLGLNGQKSTNTMAAEMSFYSTIPTGRLSAKRNQTVYDYLEKVKEHESLSNDQPWRKNVLHLSGGFQEYASEDYNAAQIKLFRTIVDGFSSLARVPYLGANVTTFSRSTRQSAEIIDVSSHVNKGVSLITFFGHSSPNVTDISIGYVSDNQNIYGYNNRGKYPLLYLNGCQTGNTFFDQDIFPPAYRSLLIDWVTAKNKGAIVGLANSSTGFVHYLKMAIENMYISSFLDSVHLGKSIGEQITMAQKRYLGTYTIANNPDEYGLAMIENNTLQGDPAVRLFPSPRADYSANCERIALRSYQNKKITTATDSFEVIIPIKNTGVFTKQPFTISIKRTFANNTKTILYAPQTFFPIREQDSVRFKIKGAIPEAAGANLFEITIDQERRVPELNENNNVCSITVYLPGTTMLCLAPKKFSIVNKQRVDFVAQSTTLTTKERTFYFELDTNFRFSSPFKKSFTASSFNLPRWENQLLSPDSSTQDSTVFYWRVRYIQPEQTEDTAYSYSSFVYIKNSSEGWSQSDYPQFLENNTSAIRLDSLSGKWSFTKLSSPLKVSTSGKDAPGSTATSFLSFRDVPQVFNDNCRHPSPDNNGANGFYLIAINPIDLSTRVTKRTHPGDDGYYQCNAYNSPFVTRFLLLNPTYPHQFNYLYETLKDTIKNGEIVLMMSIGDAGFSYFPDSLRQVMKTLYGASQHIDSLKNGHPYILLGRKGIGPLAERLPIKHDSLKTSETLSLDTMLVSLGYAGYISSSLIGPSTKWGNFQYRYEKAPLDSIRFDIAGIDTNGNEKLLIGNVKQNGLDLGPLISTSTYPFLRLHAYKETETFSTPQLLKWQISFRGSPEGSLIISDQSKEEYSRFSLQEGDTSKTVRFSFKNISSERFQSPLLVRYKISSPTKSMTRFDTLKVSLQPDSIWTTHFRIPTWGFVGENRLEVFFNPLPGQKEEYLENNTYTIPYTITPTPNTPLTIEVAFDGQHIMNRDIVLPNPTIQIAIHDESKYFTRTDTTGIRIELQRPCSSGPCPFEKIDLTSRDVFIHPASGSKDKFEIIYKPSQLSDGIHTLRVQSKDLLGNTTKPYTIQFEVVNQMTITNFLPYPNPFSSKMWFVYTLTGDFPDQIRIQILTITGKVVKQIFQEELGPLRIGTHKTDFIWDGTDDYGDQLANGLYLYRVQVRKGGQELTRRETSADDSFKNGYGKLYILR